MSQKDLIEKIRNLRAKAESEASTEAEVAQAAMMAGRLMAKHGITEAEIAEAERTGDGIDKARFEKRTRGIDPALDICLRTIGDFTDCRILFTFPKGQSHNKDIHVVGFEADREMAFYLIELIIGASKRAWANAWAQGEKFKNRSAAMKSFKRGFGVNIAMRLREMIKERQAQKGTGTALVVRKTALVDRRIMENEGHIETARSNTKRMKIDQAALAAGFAAAADLNLGRPLEGDQEEREAIQ